MWAVRCLLLLLCGAELGAALRLDFAEHRSQANRIKVNPRGNLWATGHFMGKKSVLGPEEPPSPRALLEELGQMLSLELLRLLWRERLLDQNQNQKQKPGRYHPSEQGSGLLTKTLEKYFSS